MRDSLPNDVFYAHAVLIRSSINEGYTNIDNIWSVNTWRLGKRDLVRSIVGTVETVGQQEGLE